MEFTMTKLYGLFVGVAATSIALGGCVAQSGSDSNPTESTGANTGMVQRTVVHRRADGSETVNTYEITREQASLDLAAFRARQDPSIPKATSTDGIGKTSSAVVQDSSCAGADMWLYDQTNFAGNEICFYSNTGGTPDTAYLSDYCRVWLGTGLLRHCVATWQGSVQSWYSGADPGAFIGTAPLGCVSYFRTYQSYPVADACVYSANQMTFYYVSQ